MLRCRRCSIQNHENRRFRLSHCRLTPPHQRTPANIRTNFMSPETRSMSYIFVADSMGLSSFIFLWWAPKDASILEQNAYRPFKVIQGRWFWHQSKGRIRVYDFPLVINSNFGPILHRFWDTASYWLKIANFCYATLVWRPHSGGTRQNFRMKLSTQKLEGWGYCTVKIAWS